MLPMGATLVSDRIYDSYRGASDRALCTGTPSAAIHSRGARREVLAIYEDEDIVDKRARRLRAYRRLRAHPGHSRRRPRAELGMTAPRSGALEGKRTSYLGQAGWRVYEEARRRGAYLRPRGHRVRMPPS